MNAPTHIQRTSSRRRSGRSLLALLVSVVFMVGLVGVLSSPAFAGTLTVTNANDSGPGSLRQAIADASPGDTITFSPNLNGQTITLTSGQLVIDKNLTIEGPGADKLAVSGNNASRVLAIGSWQGSGYSHPEVSMSGLKIRDAHSDSHEGGGIKNLGSLTLTNSIVSDNYAYNGAGIMNGWAFQRCDPAYPTRLTLEDSIVRDNTAAFGGGGIDDHLTCSNSSLTIVDSTISGNKAGGNGGLFHDGQGTVTIINSTISNNWASNDQGGIMINGGQAKIVNSTISGNVAGGSFAGGIRATSLLTIDNSTIFNNSGPDADSIYTQDYARVTLKNTIVASPQSGSPNCFNDGTYGATVTSEGNNLEDGDSCGFSQTTDQTNTNPLLHPLADNGGPTQTHALQEGSPAIDKAATVEGITTDQRGVARPQGPAPDIGSFELAVTDTTAPTVTSTVPTANATGVARGVNVKATFSEEMDPSYITRQTFKLYKKGSTTQLSATVSYDPATKTATLNPFGSTTTLLARGVTYKAVVTTVARDLAGNQLDQNPSLDGPQQKKWFFTIKR